MNRITKLSIVLYGSVIFLMIMDLILLLLKIDTAHSVVSILLAFFSITVINLYIQSLKDREKRDAEMKKNKFRIVNGHA